MAFAAVGALIGGTAAVTAATVLAAVAEVGMALTVVGAVTGSKTLMKIGGAMSLIGGVGGMIAGAASGGAAAAGAAEGAAATGAAEAAAGAAGEAGVTLGSDAFGYGMAEGAGGGFSLSGMEGAAGAGELAAGAGMPQGLVAQEQSGLVAREMAPKTALEQATGAPSVTDVATPQAPMGAQAPAGAQAPTGPAVQGVPPPPNPNAPEASGSFFGKMSTFAEQNKTLFAGGMNAVTGLFKGANERSMWNEKMENERTRLKQIGYGNQVARWQPRPIFQGGTQ